MPHPQSTPPAPVAIDEGKVREWFAAARDITQQKQAASAPLQAFQAHRPHNTSATAAVVASEPPASSTVTTASRGRLA